MVANLVATAVKTAVLVQRINNITFEQFDEFWRYEHPKAILQVPTFVEKVLNYTQWHTYKNASGQYDLGSYGSSIPFTMAKWDGIVEIYTNTTDDAFALFADPVYNEVVVPNEDLFLNRSTVQIVIGEEQVIYVNNQTGSYYWSSICYASPYCVFTPSTANQVSVAVKVMARFNATFAVRGGGGHMPIPLYSNTDGGVLIAPTDLNTLQLSDDQESLAIGPGNHWGTVYEYLEPYGLIVVGGRVGSVGVPGLLLGGGVSFYASQYGFASSNVISYEIVLANGTIATASATENPDLFWALKGGGNSLGIVTLFTVKTYPSPQVCVGDITIDFSQRTRFLDATANYANFGALDAKSASIPALIVGRTSYYLLILFYDGPDCNQTAFSNYTAIAELTNDGYGNATTLGDYASGSLFPSGNRELFRTVGGLATRETVEIMNDAVTSMAQQYVGVIDGFAATAGFQTITKDMLEVTASAGGNPQNVDLDNAPYFWLVMNFEWLNAADDEILNASADVVISNITEQLTAAGLHSSFLFMNDAGAGQEVFQNYGNGSLSRLKSIRDSVDPHRVFTDLMPGGWKFADL
ncbi:Bifunctional solanapyrone synthase 4 [Phlyctema vagabunda]|uniref:Bifunctional solanapyrone synthase 4 n=1 Tax=Phlyctema vagabunda TaxID=108571 RepID=A0ABR4PAK7_9HELO